MKVKQKRLILGCAVFLFAIVSIFALSFADGGMTVYAATTPKYQLKYDYYQYYHRNSGLNLLKKENNIYSSVLNYRGEETTEVNLYIYGDSFTETIRSNYVSLTEGILQLDADFPNCNMTVTDSTGMAIAEGNKQVTLSDLTEGRYNISVDIKGEQWNLDENTVAWYSVVLTATFYVDITPPTITGASLSETGLYTKARSTVTASDNAALENIYMKEPNSDGYSAVGTSVTLPEKSADGLYSFYAKDMAGNVSATYYIYYDIIPPTGEIKNVNGEVIDTVYTNQAFCYVATDSGSGIRLLQVQNPFQSLWTNYVSGTLIKSTATNGKYNFRSVDKCGTISETKSIYLDTTNPTGTLYGGENIVSNGSTTTESYVKFIPSDTLSGVKACFVKEPNSTSYSSYISGSQFSELGTYFFYCVDNANNISEIYTVTLAGSHTHSYSSQIISPTCTSGGYTLHTCSCGSSYTDNVVAAFGHNYSEWQTTSDASCTSSGTRSSVCSRCGQTKTETLVVLGHDFSILVSSTGNSCLAAGTSVYKCSRCTVTQTISGTALGHDYKAEIHSATCTAGGYITHICSRCGDAFTDSYTTPLEHRYTTETVKASCTEGGYILHKCTRCDDEYKMDVVSALGHNFVEMVVKATCTDSGGVYHACTTCEFEYMTDEKLPSGHSYSSKVALSATCTQNGERQFTCDKCGDFYTTAIPATEHNYQITDVQSENGFTRRTYTCSSCGHSYTQDMGDQYEKVTNYVEYLFDQYSPYMMWLFLATAGIWSIAIGVAIIIARKNEDKEKAKKMLVNYVIGLVVIFAILVACPYLVRGIAILVT